MTGGAVFSNEAYDADDPGSDAFVGELVPNAAGGWIVVRPAWDALDGSRGDP